MPQDLREVLVKNKPGPLPRPLHYLLLEHRLLGELDLHRQPHLGRDRLAIVAADGPTDPLGTAVEEVGVWHVAFDPQLGVEHSNVFCIVPAIDLPVLRVGIDLETHRGVDRIRHAAGSPQPQLLRIPAPR